MSRVDQVNRLQWLPTGRAIALGLRIGEHCCYVVKLELMEIPETWRSSNYIIINGNYSALQIYP
jgi:hypothetical protein